MSLLKDITIQNFRGIDKLEIHDFADINLFIGNNNCGKTSIIESIFLLIGMSNPTLVATINQIRGLFTTPDKLRLLFHNINLNNEPKFTGNFYNGNCRELIISARKTFDLNYQSSEPNIEIEGLNFNFTIKKLSEEKKYSSSLKFIKNQETSSFEIPQMIRQSGFNIQTAVDYEEDHFAIILPPNKDEINLLRKCTLLLKQKKNKFVLDLLQQFDENIKSIQLLPDGIYFELSEAKELLPLNAMGGGIGHFLNVATSIAEQPNAIICVDEIENGLHFSKYHVLWKYIFDMVKANRMQLFITTHNIETLKTLANFLSDNKNKDLRNMAKVFTVADTAKEGYKSYSYSFDSFVKAIEQNIELRN